MRSAPPLAYPNSRVLAGWWRQLAPLRPQALWVGHLFLHRVEALVRTSRPARADPFTVLVLRALALGAPSPLEHLEQRLHLGPAVLAGVLRELSREGLVEAGHSGRWRLTPAGRACLETGEYRRGVCERRQFHFLADDDPARAPHFVRLTGCDAAPWPQPESWAFDPSVLPRCAAQPEEWKRRHGFPVDVEEVLMPAAGEPCPPWERVVVDRPEHLAIVAALVPGEGDEAERFVALPVQTQGWVLQTAPVLTLGSAWREVFPKLAVAPGEEVWRQAWQAWCQRRGVPPDDAASCSCSQEGTRLRVTAPVDLIERLGAAAAEAWLLPGEGRLRPAAMVELVEAPAG